MIFSLLLLVLRPVIPGLFGVTPEVRCLLLAVLLVIIVKQPVAGAIRAGRRTDLRGRPGLPGACGAWRRWPCLAGPAAALVGARSGLVALWLAYAVWMLTRFAALTLRSRTSRWLVTGAVR